MEKLQEQNGNSESEDAMSLLVEIDRYLRRTGVAPTTFGRRAVNDPRLVLDMRAGRMPGAHVRARVEALLRGAE
ncbi:hypothetical protein [uncultured Sphingomonas sp.]|uniref:hypothetical protein n=2 Tax=Sphingomonas TaxID=13687 RepID=UPI0025E9B456|nr:hypothetical protein [uncultured Sphingomonas sp.]